MNVLYMGVCTLILCAVSSSTLQIHDGGSSQSRLFELNMKNGKVKGQVSRLDAILVKYHRPAAAAAAATSDGKAAGFAFSLNFDSFSKFV